MVKFKFKPGDTVGITGKIYQSANGTLTGKTLSNFKGTIKKIAEKAAHPYAIEEMWGWFDEKELKPYIAPPEIFVGDKVQLIKNINYIHKEIKASPKVTYIVKEIDGDKVNIQSAKGTLSFVVNIYNLKKVEEE